MLKTSPDPATASVRCLVAVVLVVSLLAVGCGGVNETAASPTTTAPKPLLPFGEELQDVLDEAVNADNAMGVSLTVLVPGYEPWLGVAGKSEPALPIATDMAFGAGSISKSFIAALILQLAEEGELSLDDQLSQWIADAPNIDTKATIRQLLNHTSGTFQPNHHPDFFATVFSDGDRVWTDEEVFATFQLEPYSVPGTEWHYSNAGYTLLGQIIEQATGSSVSAELRRRFFEPLGLTSAFYLTEEAAPVEVAEGWMDIGLYAPEIDIDPDFETFSQFPWTATMPEAGGIFASSEDLATWAQALWGDANVLSAASMREMLDFVPVDLGYRPTEDDPEPPVRQLIKGYGLGAVEFAPELFDGTVVIGHSGGALFYSAASLYLPAYGVTIGAAQNFDHDDIFGWIVEEVVAAITAHFEARS